MLALTGIDISPTGGPRESALGVQKEVIIDGVADDEAMEEREDLDRYGKDLFLGFSEEITPVM